MTDELVNKLDDIVRRINDPKDKLDRNMAIEELITYCYKLESAFISLCDKIKLISKSLEVAR